MATSRLPQAQAGDTLTPSDLASAVAFANAQAAALNAAMAQTQQAPQPDEATLADMRRQRDAFSLSALKLSTQAIALQAGEARVGAEHIASAIAAARQAIDAIADVNQRLGKLRAVLDFLAAVATGRGQAIVDRARTLKKALDG